VKTSVLLYHDLIRGGDADASGFPGGAAARYKLDWGAFLEHLDALERATAGPPDVIDDLLAGRAAGQSWSITFDDGGSSALAAGEELARRGWRGHFFCVSDLVGRPGFLGAEEITALRRMGHVIGSHSRSHPVRISALSWPELVLEWRMSAERLGALVGEPVLTAAVRGGYYSRPVAGAAAAAGVKALFTSEPVRRARSVDGCLVVGRHAVRRTTPAETVAQAAAGRRRPWLRQRTAWTAAKAAKAVGGDTYVKARSALLARR
jgi:peptidoglycan/xylan/chitin deacetylase (PgdA/CDA1 family)